MIMLTAGGKLSQGTLCWRVLHDLEGLFSVYPYDARYVLVQSERIVYGRHLCFFPMLDIAKNGFLDVVRHGLEAGSQLSRTVAIPHILELATMLRTAKKGSSGFLQGLEGGESAFKDHRNSAQLHGFRVS